MSFFLMEIDQIEACHALIHDGILERETRLAVCTTVEFTAAALPLAMVEAL